MLVNGPFTVTWGDNTIEDIEDADITYETREENYETVKGKTIELDRASKVSVVLTLLATDIPALAILLPQHFVPQGGVLSTGETVESADGAIDIIPHECSEELIYNDLDLISCSNPPQITRIVNARSKLDGFEMTSKIRKVRVKLIGESGANEAIVQMLMGEYVAPPDYLLLEDDDFFLLDADGYLVL